MQKDRNDYTKSTDSGRLYIETDDFFKQPQVQRTIESLLKSDIVKEIEDRKRNKLQEA